MMGRYPDYYPNLPGAIVQLNDGVKNLQSTNLSGKKILIVGQAKDGPVLEKVDASSYKQAENIFGKYYKDATGTFNNNHLMKNYNRVLKGEADNVSLMRIGGKTATAEIPMKTVTQKISKKSKEVAEAYGNIETVVDLEIPTETADLLINGTQYDKSKVNNVMVTADNSVLSADKYYVNNDNGEVTIEPNVTNTEAEIEIEYDLIYIKKVDIEVSNSVSGESLVNTGDDKTFTFANKFVDESSLVLEDDSGTDITSDIDSSNSDFEFGKVVLKTAYSSGVTADYDYFDYETPSKTADNQYQLNNSNVIGGTEKVYLKDKNTTILIDKDKYEIDEMTGLLSIHPGAPTFSEVSVDYSYRKTTTKENKSKTSEAKGTDQYIWLDNYADPSKPVIIKANGEELREEQFEINFRAEDTTIVKINSGHVKNEEQITLNYYYNEEKTVKPVIEGESPFGGTIYNDTTIEIKDELAKRTNYFYKIEDHKSSPLNMTNIGSDMYVFPDNHRNIEEGSVSLVDFDSSAGTGTSLVEETDYNIYSDTGKVELLTSLTGDLLVEEYAYKDSEESFTTTVRGQYDPDNNDYLGTFLKVRDNVTAVFKHENIVPKTLDLSLVNSGSTQNLTEDDHYTVDYASGVVHFNKSKYPSMFPLSITDKVFAQKYEYYNVTGKKVTIKKPQDKKITRGEDPLEFNIGADISTIGEFIDAVNTHNLNNVVALSVDFDFQNNSATDIKTPDVKVLPGGTINSKEISLNFGSDGLDLTKDELYKKLEGVKDSNNNVVEPGAYDLIMNEEDVDIILLAGIYADDELLDSDKDFASQLANFCARSFYRNNEVYGVIGTKPIKNPSMINVMSAVEDRRDINTDFFLEDQNGDIVLDDKGQRVDIGKYINVIAYDKIYNDSNLAMSPVESGAAEYASLASMIEENNSPTNEIVPQGSLAYDYSLNQASKLADNKLVTAKTKRGQARIVSALTCAQKNSGWTRHFTRDIVYDAIETARNIFDRYIGKGNSLDQRNSLDSDLRDALKKMTTIIDFDFDIIMNPEDAQIGRIIIELDITPVGELQKIHTVVSINANID